MKERAPSDIINFQPKIYLKPMKKYKNTTFQCAILKLVKIPDSGIPRVVLENTQRAKSCTTPCF